MQLKSQEVQAQQQLDGAMMQLKQTQAQFEQQMAARNAQFDQMMAQAEAQAEERVHQLKAQVELMANEQNNHQKQMTELLKNRDDNETKIAIEQMSQQLNALSTQAPQEQIDITPQLQALNQTLSQLGKDQTSNALGEVMNGLRATIETLNKPKTIIRDAQGKAQGIK